MKLTLSLVGALLLPLATLQAAKPLNILFFTADHMNYDSSGLCGGPIKDLTPNLDRLAGEGLRFEFAYSTVAVCQPGRQTMQTGLYPHRSGSMGFYPIKPEVRTLNQQLHDLDVGRGLKGTLVFRGSNITASNGSVRIGFFDYADGATRLTADGFGNNLNAQNVRGYKVTLNYRTNFSANPFSLYARNNLSSSDLMGTTANFLGMGGGPGGYAGAPAFQNGIDYALDFTIARKALSSVVTTTVSVAEPIGRTHGWTTSMPIRGLMPLPSALAARSLLGVLDDLASDDPVPFSLEPLRDVRARGVVFERSRIGDSQHGDTDRNELALHPWSLPNRRRRKYLQYATDWW